MISADLIEAAVLLEILELKRYGGPDSYQIEEAQRRLRAFKENGDDVDVFIKGPHTRTAFRVYVEVLAVLAFAPGGVVFCGRRFEACPALRDMP